MHRTRTTNAYGTTAATQEGGDWDLFIELQVVDGEGGTRPRSGTSAPVGPLRLCCHQNWGWCRAEGRLSKCLVCEQILAPATQLASHAAPRLRISFPQAWPRVVGKVARVRPVACSKKRVWTSWPIGLSWPRLFWAVWSPPPAMRQWQEGREKYIFPLKGSFNK